MFQYVIYFNPSDYPRKYVVRMWEITSDGSIYAAATPWVHDTLEQARNAIPEWCALAGRAKEDDPCIVEVWI